MVLTQMALILDLDAYLKYSIMGGIDKSEIATVCGSLFAHATRDCIIK